MYINYSLTFPWQYMWKVSSGYIPLWYAVVILRFGILSSITHHRHHRDHYLYVPADADLGRRASVLLCQFEDRWVPQSLPLGQGAVPLKHNALLTAVLHQLPGLLVHVVLHLVGQPHTHTHAHARLDQLFVPPVLSCLHSDFHLITIMAHRIASEMVCMMAVTWLACGTAPQSSFNCCRWWIIKLLTPMERHRPAEMQRQV